MKDAFFLGSGVSTPTALSTTQLTDQALTSFSEYVLESDERWRRAEGRGRWTAGGTERASRVEGLMKDLALRVDDFYAHRTEPAGCLTRVVNYEDIGFLADAIAATLSFERDDPAIVPLIEEVAKATALSKSSLNEAAEDTVNFLRDMVHAQLAGLQPTPTHLEAVAEACEGSPGLLPLYTLNHDCLIESTLRQRSLDYDDLMRTDGERRLLTPLASLRSEARAVIYKLHGSLDWRRFKPMSGTGGWFAEWVGHERSQSGEQHDHGVRWRSDRPLILLGRFNKELDYLSQPYLDLVAAFTQSLRSRRRLFVSGYGFGDKAINSMLIEWAFSEVGKKLVVLHQDETSLVDGARGAIRKHWSLWKDLGILTVVPKFLNGCNWDELDMAGR